MRRLDTTISLQRPAPCLRRASPSRKYCWAGYPRVPSTLLQGKNTSFFGQSQITGGGFGYCVGLGGLSTASRGTPRPAFCCPLRAEMVGGGGHRIPPGRCLWATMFSPHQGLRRLTASWMAGSPRPPPSPRRGCGLFALTQISLCVLCVLRVEIRAALTSASAEGLHFARDSGLTLPLRESRC